MAREAFKASVLAFALVGASATTEACPVCRPKVRAEVYTPHFASTLGLLLLPLGLMAMVGVGVGRLDKPVSRKEQDGR